MYSMNCTAPDSEIHDESMDFHSALQRFSYPLHAKSQPSKFEIEESLSQAEKPAFDHAYDS
jgi:hypothetical protein